MARRTYYAGFNTRLYRLIDWIDAYQKRMVQKTGMDSAAQTELNTLMAALNTASTTFPRRVELP